MAKRRRLDGLDLSKVQALEEGFAAKPQLETKSMAPIAQVAGDTARAASALGTEERRDAALYRQASAAGLVAITIPIDQIDADHIRRDRVGFDAEEMAELKASLQAHGQRNPIEVVKTPRGFGLISGWRRLRALQELEETTVKAFLREGQGASDIYRDMVEENEIRANLSPYERGRIASVAVGQGAFADLETAVAHLFASASKAKRSKIRSFAAVHEALGDLLRFPTELPERLGLKLAAALSQGQNKALRAALDTAEASSSNEEQRALMAALSRSEPKKDASKGGRPSAKVRLPTIALKSGGELNAQLSARGVTIELADRVVNPDTAARMLRQIERLLDGM